MISAERTVETFKRRLTQLLGELLANDHTEDLDVLDVGGELVL